MNDEILTWAEIKARYPSEWVLIGEPEVSAYQEVLRGKVLFHSPDRDEIDRKALELRPRNAAFLYTSEWPQGRDEEFIL